MSSSPTSPARTGDENEDSPIPFLVLEPRPGYPTPRAKDQPWKRMNVPLTHDHRSPKVIVNLHQCKGAMPPGQGLGGH